MTDLMKLADETAVPGVSPALFASPTLALRPWVDELIDTLGFDPRSSYVERFWLPILGPSTTWLLRRVAMAGAASPMAPSTAARHWPTSPTAVSCAPGGRMAPAEAYPRIKSAPAPQNAHPAGDSLAVNLLRNCIIPSNRFLKNSSKSQGDSNYLID